ncbi:uncharacterized protein F5147DRAFT_697206 [Suillus discolor]|uniref:Uncharacterized protein n=1 Tax=Suillus discolor TaxID=1912936 RepID=A0A9P7JT59_9AGAM|nr:uncharacterized protein F5147DRAFT_697206 [Suillus discolor]KAG2107424.1 hypothetical protein F5147DRAFT_697206 [Suillus discolor]
MIFPALPKPSQQSIRRNWLPGTLCSGPHLRNLDVFMDPAQNLIAVAYAVDNKTVYINLGALDGDGVHPQAAGEKLFLLHDLCYETTIAELKGFGRHIALSRHSDGAHPTLLDGTWQLQIWDWKYSTTSSSILSGAVGSFSPANFCFLGNNRLLVITDNLNLYSIKNIQVFIISTRIFFDLDEMAAAMPIPWEHWAPSNTRIFWHPFHIKIHIHGNRVLQTLPVGTRNTEFILQLLDFSPLAVTNRRGLGRVVKEPAYIYANGFRQCGESLTTSLPYVEVVFSERKFGADSVLKDMWIDKDGIYMLSASGFIDRLEVIDVQSDLRSGVVSTS